MTDPLSAVRQWYAETVRLRAPVIRNPSIVDAFAAVPRERFLGPGPWQILSDRHPDKPFLTPDDAPHWVCHDVLVTIDKSRQLNNGMPSFWGYVLDHLDLCAGERVVQVGAGTGYYAAILAEIVGVRGRVTAIETDELLAQRARDNLAPWRQVDVVAGDGRQHDAGMVDTIVVFAGSTHPAPLWLDRLADGGRLIMPLTTESRWGFMLRVRRQADSFEAASVGQVGIFPCVCGRDAEAGARLERALDCLPAGGSGANLPIRALHRGQPTSPELAWYHGPGFWLERRQIGP